MVGEETPEKPACSPREDHHFEVPIVRERRGRPVEGADAPPDDGPPLAPASGDGDRS